MVETAAIGPRVHRSEEDAMSKLRHSGKLLGEFVDFAKQNKVYWIVPLVLVLVLGGILVFASQSATPFIYTLF